MAPTWLCPSACNKGVRRDHRQEEKAPLEGTAPSRGTAGCASPNPIGDGERGNALTSGALLCARPHVRVHTRNTKNMEESLRVVVGLDRYKTCDSFPVRVYVSLHPRGGSVSPLFCPFPRSRDVWICAVTTSMAATPGPSDKEAKAVFHNEVARITVELAAVVGKLSGLTHTTFRGKWRENVDKITGDLLRCSNRLKNASDQTEKVLEERKKKQPPAPPGPPRPMAPKTHVLQSYSDRPPKKRAKPSAPKYQAGGHSLAGGLSR